MKKSLLAILFGMTVLSFGAFNFTSCEVGLGAAVDVEAPTLVIESPKTSVIIRDAFAISGTWKDDGNIDELTVVLRDTTTDKKTSYTGNVVQNPESEEAEGSWSVIIDPVTEDIVDGSYEATVTISDKGGHSTVLTRSFVIDNTAPIIVLTRPSTAADSESSDTYGQTFTLEGQAADTNSVNLIEVEIYSDKDCTPESYLHTVPLKNVPNSINMDVAKFEKGITDNDYYKIYKDATTDGGAKDFYCKVIAYDGAQRYPTDGSAPTEADKKGNATSNYYLYKDIATEILSEYKVNKVYEIFNGTFQDDGIARTITKESVIEKLSKNVRTEGRFTLNPKNNPTFAVTGRNPLLLDGTDFAGTSNNISDGSQVVIEVSPGLDGILINEKSLAVYAAECNASGSKTGEAIALDFTKEESGTSYRLITKIDKNKGLVIGKNYLIYVSGYDQATSPNPIEPVGKAYGFHMASSGRAPVLEISEPALVTDYTNKLKQTFKGSVTVEVGTPVVVINYNNKEYQLNTYTSSEKAGTDTKYYFTWESPEFANANASHKFEFKGVLDSESQPIERTIVFDKDKPEINNLKIDEAKKFDDSKEDGSALSGRYINGTVNATIDITDSYDKIASASYKLIVNGDESAATEVAIADANLPKFAFPAINTTNYANGTTLTIKVTAKDRAGNEQTFSENFIVDQETDKPWIWPRISKSVSLKLTNANNVTKNLNTITAGSNLEVRIYDDDGTDEDSLDLSVKISKKITKENQTVADNEWSDVSEFSLVDDVITFKIPEAGGFYKYKVRVTDKVNNLSRETQEFVISAAKAEATITDIKKSPEYVRNATGQTFVVTIEGVSSQGPYKLFRRIGDSPDQTNPYAGFGEIPVNTSAQADDPNSTADRVDFPLHDIFTLEDGVTYTEGTKVYYYVEDATPRDSNSGKFFTLTFDDVAPVVTISTPNTDTSYIGENAISDATFRFEGDIEEANSLSGVYYQIKANNGAQDETPTGSDSLDATKWTAKGFKPVTSYGTTSFKINQTFIAGTTDDAEHPDYLHEGQNYKLYVFAVDKAGNVSEVKSRLFDVDRSYPAITTSYNDGTEHVLTDSTSKVSTKKDFSFTYTATDTFGLRETNPVTFSVTKDGTDFTDFTDTNGTVILNEGSEDGLYTFTITATDKVGKSTPVTRNIRLDSTGPTINIATGLDGYQTSDTISVNGTAEDVSGVDKVYYSFADTEAADLSDSTWHATTNATNWSFEMAGGTDGAVKKLHLCAVDKNGVASAVITREVKYDLANPSVTETGIGSTEKTYNRTNTSFTLTGSVSDTNGIKSLTITDEENNTYAHNLTPSTTEPYSYTTSAPGTWTVTCPIGTSAATTNKVSDGTHSFTITATDAAGKTSTVQRTIIVDTELPTLTLSALPDKNEMLSTIHQTTLRGTANDGTNGSGISKVELTIANSDGTSPKTVTASGTNSWMTIIDFTDSEWEDVFGTQGEKKISLKVTDIAGNDNSNFYFGETATGSTVTEKTFIYDNAAPEIAVTSSIGDYMKEAGITISGTVTDNYGFTSLIVNEYKKNADNTYSQTENSGKDITPDSATTEWSVPVPLRVNDSTPVPASEGNYKYEFIAKDSVGHETKLTTKTIIVDKTPPEITSVKLDDENYGTKEWYSSNTIQLKVSATDPGTTGVSGMATVQYSTDNLTWANLSQKDNVYQAMVQFSDGTNNLWIRALDNADNTTYFDGTKNEAGTLINPNGTTIPTSVTVKVDTSAPELETKFYQFGTNGSLKNIAETIYMNATDNSADSGKITFYGTYHDGDSGVTALSVANATGAKFKYSTSEITDDAVPADTAFENFDSTNAASYKSWKAEFTPTTESTYKIIITGTNKATLTSKSEFSLIRDVTAPALPTFSFEEITESGENKVTKPVYKSDSGKYYTNNTSKTYKLSGTSSDKYGVASVTISGNITATTKSDTESPEDWEFDGITISGNDNDTKNIYITVKDNAGNEDTKPLTVVLDKTAPTGMHLYDAAGKDIFFRIGAQNRDEGVKEKDDGTVTLIEKNDDTDKTDTHAPEWDAEKDKDVGGKYSEGTFGNATTIKIRGKFVDLPSSVNDISGKKEGSANDPETGSGVKMIYYWVTKTAPATADKTARADLAKTVKGYNNVISPKSEIRRVFFTPENGDTLTGTNSYNVTDGTLSSKTVTLKAGTNDKVSLYDKSKNETKTKYYMDIESTFSETISDFKAGENHLVIVAEDNAGNYAVDVVKVNDTTDSNNFSINVDQKNPDIASDARFKDTIFTNTESPTTIYGLATDTPTNESSNDAAGVKSVVIEVNGKKITKDDTTYGTITLTQSGTEGYTKYNTKWTAVIKPEAFAGASGNISVYATVTDYAGEGNSQKPSVATVNVDITPPVPTIESPSDADKNSENGIHTNGTITLNGSASDTNGINRIVGLLYKVDNTATTMSAPEEDRTLAVTATDDDITNWFNKDHEKAAVAVKTNGWKKISATITTENNNTKWTASNINTAKLDGTTDIPDDSKVWLVAAVQDKAGTIGFSTPVAVIVNQNTDRPIVSFSNIDLGTTTSKDNVLGTEMTSTKYVWLKNTTKIIGTVSDDDGIAANGMKISLDGSDWKNVNINGSSFSYDLKDLYTETPGGKSKEEQANGTKKLYFQITDTANTTPFTSSETSSHSAIYMSDGTNTYGDSAKSYTILHVTVDTIYPEIVLQGVKIGDASDEAYTTAYNTITLGGSEDSFTVKFTATDTTGIKTSAITGKAEFPYGTGTDKITVTANEDDLTEPTEEAPYYTLKFALTDAQKNLLKAGTGYAGAINVKITVYDSADNSTSQTATLAYDYKPSAITFSKPVSTTPQSGEVSAYGNVSEIADVYYTISPSGTVGAGESVNKWYDGDGNEKDLTTAKSVDDWARIEDATLAWTINFDNKTDTNGTHTKSLNKYLIDYGIATHDANSTSVDSIVSSFNDFVTLYLWVKTVDSASNIKTEVHPIVVDPQGDRPNCQFSYPLTSNGTLGGQVSIYGTATDTIGSTANNIGVDSVWVQIKSTTHGAAADTTTYGTSPSYDKATDTVSMTLKTADLDYMVSKGYQVYKRSAYKVGGTEEENNPHKWTSGKTLNTANGESADDYAALASLSGAAWNISINGSQEFDPPASSTVTTNPVAIRVYARDKDGKFSLKTERYVEFDADKPIISDLKVIKSSSAALNAAASTNSITKAYASEMYIQGESGWYLTGTVTDKDKIKELRIGTDILVAFTETDASETPTITTGAGWENAVKRSADKKTVKFKYPLTTSGDVGKLEFTIKATDGIKGATAHEGEAKILIKYDNKAPVLATSTAEGLNIDSSIYQNNKRYKFSSKAKEDAAVDGTAQSGFAYTAFYFTRSITSAKTLFDVLNDKDHVAIKITGDKFYTGTTDTTGTAIVDLGSEASTAADNTIVTDSNLYWYRKKITADSISGSTFQLSDVSGIRPSSLIKISGAFYLVTDVTGTSITVDSAVPSDAEVVYVAIAGVVNNTVPEGEGGTIQEDGYYSAPSRDDGDRMIESVDKNGTTWTWEANICSSNMSDGPVTLHYVVFDKAGNSSYSSVNGKVENNAPRLASLKVWSDFNEDGKEQEDESDTFYNVGKTRTVIGITRERATAVTSELVVSGNKKDVGDGSSFMTVKASTRFIPEIVGGNGALYYSYRYKKNKAGAWSSDAYGANSIGNGYVHGIDDDIDKSGYYLEDDGGSGYIAGRTDLYAVNYTGTKYYMEIPGAGDTGTYSLNGIGNSTSTSDPTWFEYTIYDSTDGSGTWNTTGTSLDTRLSAKFRVALDLQYQDKTAPYVKIRPFYWNGLTDNSVYTSKNSNSVSSVSDLEGHIELEGDLPDTFTIDGTGVNDLDPKVSGKIKVEGYAYDDIKLKELYVNFAGHSKLKTDTKVATYTPTAETKWTIPTHTLASDGWDFSAQDVYCNANGHMVYWTLIIDTEKLDNLVGLNKALVVYAKDDRGTEEMVHNGTTQTKITTYRWSAVKGETNATQTYYTDFYCNTLATNLTSDSTIVYKKTDLDKLTYYYKMDVVPYITGVQTRLAKMNRPNPTVYSRTAKGHYPIASDENTTGSVTLEGFNLSESGTVDISSEIDSKNSGTYSYTVNKDSTKASAEEVETFNNKNNNDAHGSYILSTDAADEKSNALNQYNRQPNTTTNLKLTDDVYFDMWEMNNRAAISKGALKEPLMKINPKNNMVGFGFVNDIDSVSFPTDSLSYTIMQKNNKDYVGTTFAFDSNGHAHTISIGLDAQAHTGIAGRMNYINSRWVAGSSNGVTQWNKEFAIALESIGIPAGVSVKGKIIPYTNGSSLGRIDIERFPNPAITVANHGEVPTVYIMYYDAEHDQIRFRYGAVNNTEANRTDTQYGLLNDSKCEYYIHSSANNSNPTGNGRGNKEIPNADNNNNYSGQDYGNHGMFEAAKDYYALVAGNYYKQRNDGKTGEVKEDANPIITTGNKGSKYYALDVVTGSAIGDDKVVMIWYDDTANKLMYMYRENLTIAGDNTDASVNGVTGKWSKPKAIFEKLLQDCTIKVDPLGGIHIAAYDQTDADLLYAYLPTYNHLDTDGNKPYTSVVDAYSQVGKYIVIDTVLDSTGTKVIPYISYFTEGMSSLPKLAFIPEGIDKTSDATRKASIKDGSDSTTNIFTGTWEVTLLPTKSPLQQYKVCVGAFRDTSNKTATPTVSGTTNSTETNGTVYPNNKTNLVVGYSIRENGKSYMETAMRKGVPDKVQH